MKKYSKLFLTAIISSFALMICSNAKSLTKEDLASYLKTMNPEASYVYVIGNYAFTSNHTLTLEDMMLAARSINVDTSKSDAEILNEMTTYHFSTVFDADYKIGGLKEEANFTGETEVPEEFNINYIDYVNIEEEYSEVVFKLDADSETYDSIVVKNGGTITLPTDPTKNGYVFVEWVDAKGNKLTSETTANGDVTYIAKWDELVNTDDFVKTALESVNYTNNYDNGVVSITLTDGLTKVKDIKGTGTTGLVAALKSLLTETRVESVTITKGDTTIPINKTDDLATIASSYETLILALADADADDYDKVVVQDLMGSEFTITVNVAEGYENSVAGEYKVVLGGEPVTGVTVSSDADLALAVAQKYITSITLFGNITVTEALTIAEGKELTIDLDGYTLTNTSTSGYTIDNQGNLTIINTSAESAEIICNASSSACIRNGNDASTVESSLTIDNVTITSNFIAVKTEANAKTVIKNSIITSTYINTDTGAIQNWGTVEIDNSTITGSKDGVAIYAISGYTSAVDSTTTVTNSILSGKYAVYANKYEKDDTTSEYVNISNSTIKGDLNGTTKGGAVISVSGTINTEASYLSTVLTRAASGTNVILTNNFSEEKTKITVPEGVTLTIVEGVTYTVSEGYPLIVNGTLVNNGSLVANAYVNENSTYFSSVAQAALLKGANSVTEFTIVVLNDSTEIVEIAPKKGKTIVIDLNGHTVIGNIVNPAGGTMTIMDSSEAKAGTFDGTITNNGTLTIESGTYTSYPTDGEGAVTTINGGTLPEQDSETTQ